MTSPIRLFRHGTDLNINSAKREVSRLTVATSI